MIFSAESNGDDQYVVIGQWRILVLAAEVLDGASTDLERCQRSCNIIAFAEL